MGRRPSADYAEMYRFRTADFSDASTTADGGASNPYKHVEHPDNLAVMYARPEI